MHRAINIVIVRATAASLFVAIPTIAAMPSSSPFGIPQGTPIKSLKILKIYGSAEYLVTPPIQNSNFTRYIVLATLKSGVCAIFASSAEYENVEDVQTQFDVLVRLLNRYGKSHTVKFGDEWPILDLTVRYFPVEWKTGLPNGLTSIVVEPKKRDGVFKVEVSYIYRNVRQCDNWNRTKIAVDCSCCYPCDARAGYAGRGCCR